MCELKKLAKDALILRKAVRTFRPQVIFLQTLLYPCYLAFLMPKSIPIIITFWNGDVLFWSTRTGTERVLEEIRAAWNETGKGSNGEFPGGDECMPRVWSTRKQDSFDPVPRCRQGEVPPCGETGCERNASYRRKKSHPLPEGAAGISEQRRYRWSLRQASLNDFLTLCFCSSPVPGAGSFLNQHREKIRQLGLEQHFRWEGQVPWDLMPVYYNASDLMVSISSNDSLPNCMMEALACELPVIMGDIPQIREWISDGNNGLLVPPQGSG